MFDSNKISKNFEAKHIANTSRLNKRVKKAYYKAIDKIFKQVSSIRLKDSEFNLNKYPILKREIENALITFHDEIELILVNGIKAEWELAIDKNVNIISKALASRKISDAVNKMILDPQEKALKAFTEMRIKGLNLSDRVWKYTNQFQSEIEQGIYAGLSEGKSASLMATYQKQYLQEPDKLFRRVRNAKGNLVLSKNARAYSPGRGIYRSSFKNALRFTRDINNRAYRTADHEKWKSIPFVLGIDIKLSNNHPRYDICDRLVGSYPANYKHTGFHTQCLCYAVPRLADEKQFEKYEDAVLNGTDDKFVFQNKTYSIPTNAKSWYEENKEKIKQSNSMPYFLLDNKKFF